MASPGEQQRIIDVQEFITPGREMLQERFDLDMDALYLRSGHHRLSLNHNWQKTIGILAMYEDPLSISEIAEMGDRWLNVSVPDTLSINPVGLVKRTLDARHRLRGGLMILPSHLEKQKGTHHYSLGLYKPWAISH